MISHLKKHHPLKVLVAFTVFLLSCSTEELEPLEGDTITTSELTIEVDWIGYGDLDLQVGEALSDYESIKGPERVFLNNVEPDGRYGIDVRAYDIRDEDISYTVSVYGGGEEYRYYGSFSANDLSGSRQRVAMITKRGFDFGIVANED